MLFDGDLYRLFLNVLHESETFLFFDCKFFSEDLLDFIFIDADIIKFQVYKINLV